MSAALPNLEIETEECSTAVLSATAVLSSTSDLAETLESPLEPTSQLQPIELGIDLSSFEAVKILEARKGEVTSDKARHVPEKPRLEVKLPQPRKPIPATGLSRWLAMLRSRRLRIAATVASLFVVGGLIVLNWKSGASNSSDDVAELDLSEFNSTTGFDELHIASPSTSLSQKVFPNAEPQSPTDRFPRMASEPRVPPMGFVTHADHETSPGQTQNGFVPASASSRESRGAVLTGQIECDAPQRSADNSATPIRTLGMR